VTDDPDFRAATIALITGLEKTATTWRIPCTNITISVNRIKLETMTHRYPAVEVLIYRTVPKPR
jgi:hypothetical protein